MLLCSTSVEVYSRLHSAGVEPWIFHRNYPALLTGVGQTKKDGSQCGPHFHKLVKLHVNWYVVVAKRGAEMHVDVLRQLLTAQHFVIVVVIVQIE